MTGAWWCRWPASTGGRRPPPAARPRTAAGQGCSVAACASEGATARHSWSSSSSLICFIAAGATLHKIDAQNNKRSVECWRRRMPSFEQQDFALGTPSLPGGSPRLFRGASGSPGVNGLDMPQIAWSCLMREPDASGPICQIPVQQPFYSGPCRHHGGLWEPAGGKSSLVVVPVPVYPDILLLNTVPVNLVVRRSTVSRQNEVSLNPIGQ